MMHDVTRLLEVLERTPGALSGLLGGMSDSWVLGRYGEGTWNAAEVVGHLIVAEREDWMPRLRRILEHGERLAFEAFAHDATVGGGVGGELSMRLAEFAGLRAANVADLRGLGLTATDLAKTGMHPALGRVTAGQLLSTWAVHDLHHLRQVCLAMAWQERESVGPWRAYLNTLAAR